MRRLVLFSIALFFVVTASFSVSAWQVRIEAPPGGLVANAKVTVDAAGNVIAAGSILLPGRQEDLIVVKMSPTDGVEQWRTVLNVPDSPFNNRDRVFAVAVDSYGDIVAGGIERSSISGGVFFVVKLSGADGTELWHTSLEGTAMGPEGPDNAARAIALDPSGDVMVAGDLVNTGTGPDFSVLKLSGTDGSVVWRVEDRRTELSSDFFLKGRTVAVDTNGDVIATGVNLAIKISSLGTELWRIDIGRDGIGTIDANGDLVAFEAGPGVEPALVKRSSVDGAELWRVLDPPLTIASIISDTQGNVVVGGRLQGSSILLKFAGTTGAELWRGGHTSNGSLVPQALDGNGDVVAAGTVGTQFTVVKLAGSDGAELWREDSDPGSAFDAIVDTHGDVIAGGSVGDSTNSTFTVKKLRGTDGSDFVPQTEFSASPATTTPGSLITGTWSGVTTPTPTDWLGLYAVGTGHEEYLDWKYVGCEQTPTSEFASGSCQFVVSSTLAPGQYELRLFAQDGFTLLATSNAFSIDQVGAVAVQIAIRPAGSANRIDPASSGRVPVAVLSDHGFDVQTVLVDTVRFGASGTEATPVGADFSDVDGDGDTDLVLRFRIRDTGIQCGNTSALLTGHLVDGGTLVGSDAIRTVRCR